MIYKRIIILLTTYLGKLHTFLTDQQASLEELWSLEVF